MTLGPRQSEFLDRAFDLVVSGVGDPRSLLIVGPKGSGKKAVARELAVALGLEFAVVLMEGTTAELQELLFGGHAEAARAVGGGRPPGEFGTDEPTLLYLDRFHAVPRQLILVLQQAISRRRYFAADGLTYRMSPEVLVVAGLRDREPDAIVTPEHPLATAFPLRLDVLAPDGEAELRGIATGMLLVQDPGRELGADVSPLLQEVVQMDDHLHAVSRLLRLAISLTPGSAPIDAATLRTAREQDIEYQLGRIEYHGRTPTLAEFRRWQAQFPLELRAMVVDMIRHIADRYYLSARQYWHSLDQLVANLGLLPGTRVVFCLWHSLGRSNPAVMHDLKNYNRLRIAQHIDLTGPPSRWPQLTLHPPPTFVFTDDFVGTGGTLCALWEKEPRPVSRLLSAYPGCRVVVLAVAALEEGARRIEESIRQFAGRVKFCTGTRFDEGDRCLSSASRTFTIPAQRERLRLFCEEAGKKYNFPRKFWFGYEDSESLVIFWNTVPNNTLPIIWHTDDKWFPLFPASGRAAP